MIAAAKASKSKSKPKPKSKPAEPKISDQKPAPEHTPAENASLALAAAGIVYGDIGTSPLYTIKQCFLSGNVPIGRETVLGIASLVFWAIIMVVTVKYLVFVMRADNRGEGGILALLALTASAVRDNARLLTVVIALGLVGASLFIGDAMITPAISVLSAVEGLEVATPGFAEYVIPISLVILVALFSIQHRGTEHVGRLFGPVMVVWFIVLAVLGMRQIVQAPEILAAFDPEYGAAFLFNHGWSAFPVLGGVVLAITGGEALYADIGHFGKFPIRLTWFVLVLPSLVINYFGQSALLLSDPTAVQNPFYLLVPGWALWPMIGLATAATVIASQAVISGVYSVSRQAAQLGFSPRLQVEHTSEEEEGQIYVPQANWALLVAVVVLVVGFQSSGSLAAAYGIAVTGTMAITTLLALILAHRAWKWSLPACLLVGGIFMIIDLAFLGANLLKIPEGGWVPLVVGAVIFMLLTTWQKGRAILVRRVLTECVPLPDFFKEAEETKCARVPGTAVFLTAYRDMAPTALILNLKHNKVLHERNVLLTVVNEDIPRVPAKDRVTMELLTKGFYRILAHYGFMQDPDIPRLLRQCKTLGLEFDLAETSFFLGRETLVPAASPPMSRWRERVFIFMFRNAMNATDFFRIPTNRVVEFRAQVQF